MITVLAGGTGSVKLVRGLAAQENDVCVISNVGDNYWVYGMYVCPDIDTMVYGLADLLDSKRSWGIKIMFLASNFRSSRIFGEKMTRLIFYGTGKNGSFWRKSTWFSHG